MSRFTKNSLRFCSFGIYNLSKQHLLDRVNIYKQLYNLAIQYFIQLCKLAFYYFNSNNWAMITCALPYLANLVVYVYFNNRYFFCGRQNDLTMKGHLSYQKSTAFMLVKSLNFLYSSSCGRLFINRMFASV